MALSASCFGGEAGAQRHVHQPRLRLVDALVNVGLAIRAGDDRIGPALLILHEAVARADAQELALPHTHEPVGIEDALEDVTNRRPEEVERDGARDVIRDDHVDAVILGKQPQRALRAGIPQGQVDRVRG